MSGSLFSLPKTLAHASGAVIPGAQLRFFLTGTSTPTDSYQDITLSTPHAVPVEADSAGIFPVIYLSPYITYRVRLSDSSAVQIYQVDNVTSQAAESTEYRVKHTAPAVIWEETDASANNGKWRAVANSEVWALQTGNDAESWTTCWSMNRSGSLVGTSLDIDASTALTLHGGSADITLSGTEADLTATTLDFNGTLDVDGGNHNIASAGGTIEVLSVGATTCTLSIAPSSASIVVSGLNTGISIDGSVNDRVSIDAANVRFPEIGTTGSAANAFLDSGTSNQLARSTSARRYKTAIANLDAQDFSRVLSLRPIRYNSLAKADKGREFVGLIAEEVAEIDPRLVHFMDGKPDGVMYDRIVVGLLGIVQQLRKEVDELKGRH